MKYDLVISYPDGRYHLWNKMVGNEWEITFESELLLLDFMKVLLEDQR